MEPFCYTQLIEDQPNCKRVAEPTRDRKKMEANHLRLTP
jgi:hypothetical protein